MIVTIHGGYKKAIEASYPQLNLTHSKYEYCDGPQIFAFKFEKHLNFGEYC